MLTPTPPAAELLRQFQRVDADKHASARSRRALERFAPNVYNLLILPQNAVHRRQHWPHIKSWGAAVDASPPPPSERVADPHGFLSPVCSNFYGHTPPARGPDRDAAAFIADVDQSNLAAQAPGVARAVVLRWYHDHGDMSVPDLPAAVLGGLAALAGPQPPLADEA